MTEWTRRRFNQTLSALIGGMAVPSLRPSKMCFSATTDQTEIQDFAFVHLSDTHLASRPAHQRFDKQGRSVEVLKWWSERAGRSIGRDGLPDMGQRANPLSAKALAPVFAIHTGDVFEYSVVDDGWQDWERFEAAAGLPVYCVPGNHDNIWGSINQHLRRKHGGDNYSRRVGGVHFVFLNSAGPLHPLPCWDQRVLNWLSQDLSSVASDTPVILAMHHPMSGNAGYASEYDKLRFWEVIRRHRVVLILDGHWHQVRAGLWQNIPRVNGGETFRKNPGFATVRVSDGELRHRYHFHDSAQGGERTAATLTHRIDRPAPRFSAEFNASVVGESEQSVELRGSVTSYGVVTDVEKCTLQAWLDDDSENPVDLEWDSAGGEGSFKAEFALPNEFSPGRHYASLRMASLTQEIGLTSDQGPQTTAIANEQAVEFAVADRKCDVRRYTNAAGIRSPLVLGKANGRALLIFGDTAGDVVALDRESFEQVWMFSTGSEIVASVTVFKHQLLIGDGDGRMHVLHTENGKRIGQLHGLAPIYGPGLVIDDRLYFGDGDGTVHALDVGALELRWSRDVSDYGFESTPVYHPATDRLILGAWDGRYHALDRIDGRHAWSSWSARSQGEKKSRYYGPADCAPVILGSELWGTDRGYRLGRFDCLDGSFLGHIADDVAAIGPLFEAPGSEGILARTLNNQLIRYRTNGQVVWQAAVPLGRSPKPPACLRTINPTEMVKEIGVVSDTGLLSIVDAKNGQVIHRHSVTPSLYVHAPVVVDPDTRTWFAAGMDGVITAIRMNDD